MEGVIGSFLAIGIVFVGFYVMFGGNPSNIVAGATNMSFRAVGAVLSGIGSLIGSALRHLGWLIYRHLCMALGLEDPGPYRPPRRRRRRRRDDDDND